MLDLAAYQRDAEAFCRALGRERYEHDAGLKASLGLCPLYEDFAHLFRTDTFGELLEAECDPRPKRYLLDFAATGYLADRAKVLTERLAAAEAHAQVVWDEQPLPYRTLPAALANEPDARRRHDLAVRRRAALAGLNPLLEERHRTLLESTAALEHRDYVTLFDELRDLHLGDLNEAARRFLEATERVYFDALDELLGTIDLARADAIDWDLAWLFRARQFDDYFRPRALLPALYRSLRRLGFEVEESTNIALDVEPRPLKRPGAFCTPVSVPEEVRVVLAPIGGHLDYVALFGATGEAERYVNTDRTLPFPYRWLGDDSARLSYGALLEYLLTEPEWLRAHVDLDQPADYLRIARFYRLYRVRRLAVRLLYEPAVHRTDNYDLLANHYVELFTRHLGFEHFREEYLAEVEDGLRVAAAFRGWVFAAQHRRYLQREYDEEWYRLPRAGRFLRDLWREGQKYTVDELAQFMGYTGLDLRPLTEDVQAGLP